MYSPALKTMGLAFLLLLSACAATQPDRLADALPSWNDGPVKQDILDFVGEGRRLGLIPHHTDARRGWAYDRESREGRLDRALDAAPDQGWADIDMARDWRVVFPPAM